MESENKTPEEIESTDNSLETSDNDSPPVIKPEGASKDDKKTSPDEPAFKSKKPFSEKFRSFIAGMNIYLLFFVFTLALAGMIAFIAYQQSLREEEQAGTSVQELTPEALQNLTGSEIVVGDPKSLLSVESNAVFNGAILVRGSLDVAGAIKVGGALSLPGITVSGTSQFDEVQLNSLSISGSATVQGQLSVQSGLTVSGPATFSGPVSAPILNINALSLSGDLQINRHIDAGGPTPGVVRGTGVGGAGTVSISGTDTAGTVTLNVGPGAPAGVLATVTFANTFNGVPHVVITPVGSAAAALNYYLASRTTTGFSIATTNASGSASFSFDYIVID